MVLIWKENRAIHVRSIIIKEWLGESYQVIFLLEWGLNMKFSFDHLVWFKHKPENAIQPLSKKGYESECTLPLIFFIAYYFVGLVTKTITLLSKSKSQSTKISMTLVSKIPSKWLLL
jgi:hypothetical protein